MHVECVCMLSVCWCGTGVCVGVGRGGVLVWDGGCVGVGGSVCMLSVCGVGVGGSVHVECVGGGLSVCGVEVCVGVGWGCVLVWVGLCAY